MHSLLKRIIAMKRVSTSIILSILMINPLLSSKSPESAFKKNTCNLLGIAIGSYLLGSSRSLITAGLGGGTAWLLCTRTPIDWPTAQQECDSLKNEAKEWWRKTTASE
jgi:hypothetical protein